MMHSACTVSKGRSFLFTQARYAGLIVMQKKV